MSRKIHIITRCSYQFWINYYKAQPHYYAFSESYKVHNHDIKLFLSYYNDKLYLYEYEILNDELIYIRTISRAEYRKLLLLK